MIFTSLLLPIVAAFALVELCTAQQGRRCYPESFFLSHSVDLRQHYDTMRRQYTNCTYIIGNLEITHLKDPNISYDMNFLKTIRTVSGYVLVVQVAKVRTLPLDNLEVIGGNGYIERANSSSNRLTRQQFSLAVLVNDGLKRLRLPKLRVIYGEGVWFAFNRYLGYVDTVNWTAIMKSSTGTIDLNVTGYDRRVAQLRPLTSCSGGRGWNSNPVMCQRDSNW